MTSMTAEEFKAQRLALGLTQLQLAPLLGVSERMVIYYERGVHPIPRPVQLLMAKMPPRSPRS
jgi:transcriptional regulator with XRE-family HTH domain